MRVVLTALGTRGDVQPLVALGRALGREGHQVVVGAPSDFEGFVTRHGLAFRKVGTDFQARFTAAGGSLWAMFDVVEELVEEQFRELIPLARGADLLVGGGAQAAAPSVAEALGIPYSFVAYCPRLLRSPTHPGLLAPWNESPRWLNEATWWACDGLWEHFMGGVIRRYRERLGLPPLEVELYDYALTPTPILAADPTLAPPPPDWSVAQVGDLRLDDDEPLPEDVEAFLSEGEPPVYIGFGSMVHTRAVRTTRRVVEAVRRAGLRAILSSGWAGLGGADLPPSIRVIGPVSHARLFPRVRAIVHHGGAGTTHAAARAGVPQVVVPHLADQFYWGYRVHRLGVGPAPIVRWRLGAERLAAALRACVTDAGMQERARALAAAMITDGPQRAVQTLLARTVVAPRAA